MMSENSLADWIEEDEHLSSSEEESILKRDGERFAHMTQMEQVQYMFRKAGPDGVCHNDFMEAYIPRFGALIWQLRHEENWDIEKVRCDLHDYHKNNIYKYIYTGRQV
tara:strand:- start:3030 stop:3353 length:324 start_codon:yes stop_codon:yes gene_type:complete